ncbi:MAG: hypothetical protein ACTH4U_12460 [Pseudoalteromonas prydzensis]|uniref:hypothetical protein n=1 Tax=Pseudoalteromonas prydzensis TaxID=182141 RepID=UPI003F9AB82B
MKYLAILIIILISTASQAQANSNIKLTTDEGYPYKNLINKAQRIELRYVENDHQVSCKVSVQTLHNQYMGKQQTVSAKIFKKQPLAACLTRVKAKQILNML